MGSSKFATPFFKKSPLNGAYTSGAGGAVTISDAPHYAKLQSDIGAAVSKSLTKSIDNCAQLDERLATNKIGIDAYKSSKKNCAEKEKQDYLESEEGKKAALDQKVRDRFKKFQEEHGTSTEMLQGYRGEFDFFKSRQVEKDRKAAKLKEQKKEAAIILGNLPTL